MTTLSANKIGRNDPCPCGSGKKYDRCCGQSGRQPLTDPADDLIQTMSERSFASVAEASAFAADYARQPNETGRDEFDRLSPSQMAALLYNPLESPHTIEFAQSDIAASDAPIIILFNALATTGCATRPRATCRALFARVRTATIRGGS